MNWRLCFTLWLIGLPGVLALNWVAIQNAPAVPQTPVPIWVIGVVGVLQNILLLSIAAYAGTRFAPRVGLHAPVLSAVLAGRFSRQRMRSILSPAVGGGLLGVFILCGYSALIPPELKAMQQQNALPLMVRILYGGFTEEILLRWGLMTWLAWLIWRLCKGEAGVLSPFVAWTAVAISAVVFGVAHLPAANAIFGELSTPMTTYIIAGNAAFGLIAGYLFWRRGLEAAIVAHVFAHIGFATASELWS